MTTMPAESSTPAPAKKAVPAKATKAPAKKAVPAKKPATTKPKTAVAAPRTAPKASKAAVAVDVPAQPGGGTVLAWTPNVDEAPDRVVYRIPLALIDAHELNPREDDGEDVTELAESIRSNGDRLLQPVTVLPKTLHRAALDQLPNADDEGRYVLVAGHRRRRACEQLGLTHIDAIVRTDLAGAKSEQVTMILENFQRRDLRPIEEARAFQRLRELDMSQDEMAMRIGCSQSHISKRLGLLQLDEQVIAAVDAKRITVNDALAIKALDETGRQRNALKRIEEQRRFGRAVDAGQAVAQEQRQKEIDETTAKTKAELKARKVKILNDGDLQKVFGWSSHQFRLAPADLAKHQELGAACLRAKITHEGKAEYYCAQKLKCAAMGPKVKAKPTPRSAHEQEQLDNERERKKAIPARLEAAQRVEAMLVGKDEGLIALATAVASGGVDHGSYELAQTWLKAAGIKLPANVYRERLAAELLQLGGDRLLTRYAHAVLLANEELNQQNKHRMWNERNGRYLHRLVHKGKYEPTAWEKGQLAKALKLEDVEAFLAAPEPVFPKPNADDAIRDDEALLVGARIIFTGAEDVEDLPAKDTLGYVTEVTHVDGDLAYCTVTDDGRSSGAVYPQDIVEIDEREFDDGARVVVQLRPGSDSKLRDYDGMVGTIEDLDDVAMYMVDLGGEHGTTAFYGFELVAAETVEGNVDEQPVETVAVTGDKL